MITVFCNEITGPHTQEVNRVHYLNAIADIRSEFACSVEEAEKLLRDTTIDEPLNLPGKNLSYWIE